ncbi:MAG: MBOAT family protein [Bacteroidales bacterium]|nr:MBOAT family protein [Bacteroidales bacterium]
MIDKILGIFSYSSNEPLIFTRLYFWVFFVVVLAGYSVLYNKRKPRNAYLFLVSLFFYYKSSGIYFLLLLFSTVTDFFIGKRLYYAESPTKRKSLLILSIFINLFVLSYFKYSNFFIETINSIFATQFQVVNYFNLMANGIAGANYFDIDKIILPVGISFFTFQTISYTVDIYRKKITPVTNILDFGFYVSFFPQLVAGPIVRASEFIPQLYQKYKITQAEFGMAIFMILNGLLKKLFISDYIAVNLIDRVFEKPIMYSGIENLMALYGYSMQVYADFSGYTDIAIGVALLMGFRLPVNFNSPYKALHVGEFWKRWHISLSTWLKDYLYIPLGGNRHGETRTNINLMITMLLGGLWHGASWQFVIWGGLNGVGLLIYKQWRKISPFKGNHSWPVRFYAIFLTFNFITLTRIWFRCGSMQQVNEMIHQITYAFEPGQIIEVFSAYKKVLLLLIFAFIVHWLPSNFKAWYRTRFANLPSWAIAVVVLVAVFFIYQFQTFKLQPFIYFAF